MLIDHTPGPWEIYQPEKHQDGYPHNLSIGAVTQRRATYVASIPGGAHAGWAQANARLISAAPDLVAVVAWLIQERDAGTDNGLLPDGLMNAARIAIAKAKEEA